MRRLIDDDELSSGPVERNTARNLKAQYRIVPVGPTARPSGINDLAEPSCDCGEINSGDFSVSQGFRVGIPPRNHTAVAEASN